MEANLLRFHAKPLRLIQKAAKPSVFFAFTLRLCVKIN